MNEDDTPRLRPPPRGHHLLLVLALLFALPLTAFWSNDPHGVVFFVSLSVLTTPIALGLFVLWLVLHRRRDR